MGASEDTRTGLSARARRSEERLAEVAVTVGCLGRGAAREQLTGFVTRYRKAAALVVASADAGWCAVETVEELEAGVDELKEAANRAVVEEQAFFRRLIDQTGM